MKKLSLDQYEELVNRSEVVERDAYGEKVLRTQEGEMVKIFRRKRLLSSDMFWPYARRFVRNACFLGKRNILTVAVMEQSYCRENRRHLVIYRPLPGKTLREALREGEDRCLLVSMARFVATLHRKGVYFRSLHFGNIIVPPEGMTLGLIDVADMVLLPCSLSCSKRVRNFRHMLRYAEDVEALRRFGTDNFMKEYFDDGRLSPKHRKNILECLRRKTEVFGSEPPAADREQ